jgi:hypothetical protein
LHALSTKKNLNDYRFRIELTVPSFISKIKRAISTSTERNAGFKALADELDILRHGLITNLHFQTKGAFAEITSKALATFHKDADDYRNILQEKIEGWFLLKGRAFGKVLQSKGVVLKGHSQVKGLELGCNWNKHVSDCLGLVVHAWYKYHAIWMAKMEVALTRALNTANKTMEHMICGFAATSVVVDKAEKHLLQYATSTNKEKVNLVSNVMDDIYTKVSNAAREQKKIKSGPNKGKFCFVKSKIQSQRDLMKELLLDSDDDFVVLMIKKFRSKVDKDMKALIDKHIGKINDFLRSYEEKLRNRAPANYTITPASTAIRKELEQLIPDLHNKLVELRNQLPAKIKQEDDNEVLTADDLNASTEATVSKLVFQENNRKRRNDTSDPKHSIIEEQAFAKKSKH